LVYFSTTSSGDRGSPDETTGEAFGAVYALIVAIHSTVFLEGWRREENLLAHDWGLYGHVVKDEVLATFEGTYDPILDSIIESDARANQDWWTVKWHELLILMLLMLVALTMVFFLWLGNYLGRNYHWAQILNGVVIGMYNLAFKYFAPWITRAENNRTYAEYRNKLIMRRFLFQFINCFLVLYITAFLKPFADMGEAATYKNITYAPKTVYPNAIADWFGSCSCESYSPAGCHTRYKCYEPSCRSIPNTLCECTSYDCNVDVSWLVLILFTTQFLVNVSEFALPWLQHEWVKREKQMNLRKDGVFVHDVEEGRLMPHYAEEELFEDYLELAMQFGYVTLFAYYFPFASVMAFCINCFEIRFNAYLLCHVVRRPFPKTANGIGCWHEVMECMAFAAVTTNCASVFLNTNLFRAHLNNQKSKRAIQATPDASLVVEMFFVEHLFFLFKLAYMAYVPDLHPDLKRELDLEQGWQDRARVEQIVAACGGKINFSDFVDPSAEVHLEVSVHVSACTCSSPPSLPPSMTWR